MATRKIFGSFVLFCVFCITQILSQECKSAPLGMADRSIKDSQITVTSVLREAYGRQARLRQNIPKWGAWCPVVSGGLITKRNYDQFIQIDLLKLTKITQIATQGREHNGGTEKVKDYKLSYRNDGGVWYFYQGKNQTDKIFPGNKDVFTVVRHDLDPTIMARYIRVHPGYDAGINVCMRLELYSCVAEEVILSYSMPVGLATRNGKVHYKDTSYDGVIINGFCKDGTGILTDGKFGPVDAKEFKGKGWVGWSSFLTQSQYIDITFEFSGVRKFTNVTLTVNVDKKRSNAVFNRSRIFFASTNNGFSDTSFLQYCPRDFEAQDNPYNANVTLPLCENTARFMKLRLYFGGKWLLISEISFNSVPASGNEKFLQDCSRDACIVPQSSTTASQIIPFTVSPKPGCIDCTTLSPGTKSPAESLSRSSNLQLTIVIVCVILLIVIVLLVVIFLLYRRRALCFGKMKQRNKTDQTIDVELQNMEDAQEPAYDKIEDNMGNQLYSSVAGNHDDTQPMLSLVKKKSDEFVPQTVEMQNETAPKASQNNQELDCSPTDDGTQPYEEVQISPPSVYAELDRNRHDETANDGAYQKLLKRDSDYAIPAHTEAESPYEEVEKIKSPPGYAELDITKRERDDSAYYQKLIKE